MVSAYLVGDKVTDMISDWYWLISTFLQEDFIFAQGKPDSRSKIGIHQEFRDSNQQFTWLHLMLSSSISFFGSVGGFVIFMSFNLKKKENKIEKNDSWLQNRGPKKISGFVRSIFFVNDSGTNFRQNLAKNIFHTYVTFLLRI